MNTVVSDLTHVQSDGEMPFMVMQLRAGSVLQARVARNEVRSNQKEVLRIARQIASGLSADTRAPGVVHRDVSMRNPAKEIGRSSVDFRFRIGSHGRRCDADSHGNRLQARRTIW